MPNFSTIRLMVSRVSQKNSGGSHRPPLPARARVKLRSSYGKKQTQYAKPQQNSWRAVHLLYILLFLRTLYPTYICYAYFCPWRSFVHTYFIPYVHLLYVLLSVTYFCPYVLYTLRTFAIRTFVHDVLLSIRTLYLTYICDTYFCPWRTFVHTYFISYVHLLYVPSSYVHLLTYIWHTNISDTNFGP